MTQFITSFSAIAVLGLIFAFFVLLFIMSKKVSSIASKSKGIESIINFLFDGILFNKYVYGFLLLLGGVGIWIYQLYYWLNNAEWNKISLLWPLSFSSEYQDWVLYPYEWVGFHKILDFIPLSIVLILIGSLCLIKKSE